MMPGSTGIFRRKPVADTEPEGVPQGSHVVIVVGAILGILTVLFTFSMGAARIGFSMSRDGLLPRWFAKTDERRKVPSRMPVVPIVGVVFSIWLITFLKPETWLRFGSWFAIGLVSYFAHGRRKSVLAP